MDRHFFLDQTLTEIQQPNMW